MTITSSCAAALAPAPASAPTPAHSLQCALCGTYHKLTDEILGILSWKCNNIEWTPIYMQLITILNRIGGERRIREIKNGHYQMCTFALTRTHHRNVSEWQLSSIGGRPCPTVSARGMTIT